MLLRPSKSINHCSNAWNVGCRSESVSTVSYWFFPFMSVNASLVFVPNMTHAGCPSGPGKGDSARHRTHPHGFTWHHDIEVLRQLQKGESKRCFLHFFCKFQMNKLSVSRSSAVTYPLPLRSASSIITSISCGGRKKKVYGWMFAPAVCFLLLRHVTVSRFFFRNGISATISFNKWRASLQSLS